MTKIAEFANSVDLDVVAHDEPPHLDLRCLPCSLWIFKFSICYSLELHVLLLCFFFFWKICRRCHCFLVDERKTNFVYSVALVWLDELSQTKKLFSASFKNLQVKSCFFYNILWLMKRNRILDVCRGVNSYVRFVQTQVACYILIIYK